MKTMIQQRLDLAEDAKACLCAFHNKETTAASAEFAQKLAALVEEYRWLIY